MPEVESNAEPPPVAFDFLAHRRSAFDQYQRIRPLYEDFSETVREIIEQALAALQVKIASTESRAKTLDSFADKAVTPNEDDSGRPKYPNPLVEITDLSGVRIITFFLKTLEEVDRIIFCEFNVLEKLDKTDLLRREEKLGYQSLHYLVELKPNRLGLPEYARYSGLKCEIQLRTVLQHAWAEIEHDIQYKSAETAPAPIRRRFMALAGLLEIADREFQSVQQDDEEIRQTARVSVSEGRLDQVEVTGDALKTYLDGKFGGDGRVAMGSYEYTARAIRRMGFENFREIDEAIAQYGDGDNISRILYGARQGQLRRFEDMLMAAVGDRYIQAHPIGNLAWWAEWKSNMIGQLRAAGVPVGVVRIPQDVHGSDANS